MTMPDSVYLAQIQHAICGTFGLGGVLVGRYRVHLAVLPADLHDGRGEVVPGDLPLVCEVEGLMHWVLPVLVEQSHKRYGEVVCPCRTSFLVGHHVDFVFGVAQHEHGLHEVLSHGRIEPCRAHNHVVTAALSDEALTFGLGAAIHRLRVDGVIHLVRFAGIAAEDIVR